MIGGNPVVVQKSGGSGGSATVTISSSRTTVYDCYGNKFYSGSFNVPIGTIIYASRIGNLNIDGEASLLVETLETIGQEGGIYLVSGNCEIVRGFVHNRG